MRIAEMYQNYFEEFSDTCSEQNKELKNHKIASIALKTIGGLLMGLGAKATIGVVIAIPSSGLGIIALISSVGLFIFGYDFAEIGHTIRENLDQPGTQILKGIGNGIKNWWDMGFERGITYTAHAFNAQNTILISKIIKVAVHLSPRQL